LNKEIIRKSMSMKGLVGVSIKSVSEGDLQIINSMTRREFTADELYVFPVLCCDSRLDRDGDRFTKESLDQMAAMAKGVTVIFDHSWSAYGQTARLYKAEVRQAADGEYELVAWAYMPKNEKTQAVIDAIDAGILKEVSVGFAPKELQCSICKQDYFGGNCPHRRGREYDGEIAFTWINGVAEWYELSFVAVPAQPRAGVEKSWRQEQEDAKRKRLEGGNKVEKLLEFLKSLGMEVKDDDHALSIVKEWKEKADGAEKAQEDLATTKTALKKAEDDLKAAQEQLKSAPDAAMAAAGQKFFETVRNEIIKMAGLLDENTKTLEVVLRNVTDIDGLLEIKQAYQEKIDKKFPPTPQSRGAADSNDGAANDEIDLKEYQI
jgi:phage head maturation protease